MPGNCVDATDQNSAIEPRTWCVHNMSVKNKDKTMKTSMIAIAFAAAALSSTAASAQDRAWCSTTTDAGAVSCAFNNRSQCLASISGAGGTCMPNMAGMQTYYSEPYYGLDFTTDRPARRAFARMPAYR